MRSFLEKQSNKWKFFVLFLLMLITFSYAMFQGGFVSWFLFYSFMPIAIYGLLVAFYPLNKIRVERQLLKTEYSAGEKVQVTINLRRKSAFPLFYMVVEDCLSGTSVKRLERTLLFPRFQKELDFIYEMDNVSRGEHLFNEVLIKTGDPFGLIERKYRLLLENRIIVFPKYEEISYRPIVNYYDHGLTVSKDRVQRDTSMAIGIREYQPGDRFSWINWKATARRNDIMTKEFEQQQSQDIYIYMDCSQEKRFEIVVSFTASVIHGILHKGGQVGLLTVSSERSLLPVHSGKAQLKKLFSHLAKVKDHCPIPFSEVLENEKLLNEQTAGLMLVTSQLTKRLISQTAVIAGRRKDVTIFCIKGEKESLTKDELSLKTIGTKQGVKIIFVHENHFSEVFSEVSRG